MYEVGMYTIEKIKENIGDSYFWASGDEITDRCRYIANIVVSKRDSTGPSSLHLIASRVLEVANSSTIARVVHDSLRRSALTMYYADHMDKIQRSQQNLNKYYNEIPGGEQW
uniref:Uncharacterized protein n=1 Tax=Timema douglasi TaxID=61478 RepID=A0A7R8VSP7_TIMDO|nr:unnamed protein product [Timema douglasi]